MANTWKIDETAKVAHHLSLLREEYNKLQSRHAELQQQLRVVQAASGRGNSGTFLKKILQFISNLYQSDHLRYSSTTKHTSSIFYDIFFYSDVSIKLNGSSVPGHSFVLNARGDHWLKDGQALEGSTGLGKIMMLIKI